MRKVEAGQALVLVLLSLAVVLTVVLFILSRSITDISVSSGQAESVRAFSAAEAGIEKTLVVGAGSSSDIGDATYTTSVVDFSEGSTDFNYPVPLLSGDSVTTWFVAHDTDGGMICDATHPCFTGTALKVCWGNAGTPSNSAQTPAVEVSIYYKTDTANLTDFSTVRIARAALDPYPSRALTNSFAAADGSCQIGGVNYAFSKTITFSSMTTPIPAASYNTERGLLFARVKLFYNDVAHNVATQVTGTMLPSQGKDIVSTGTAGSSNRRISVFQGWPEFTYFGNVLFTPSGVTK